MYQGKYKLKKKARSKPSKQKTDHNIIWVSENIYAISINANGLYSLSKENPFILPYKFRKLFTLFINTI